MQTTATVEIQKIPASSGFPYDSWSVEVRKSSGGLLDGTWGFRTYELAEMWGKSVAKSRGFMLGVTNNGCS